jgi:hypothetical protein
MTKPMVRCVEAASNMRVTEFLGFWFEKDDY